MSTQSFIANVNILVKNIATINALASNLNDANIAILKQLLDEIDLTPIIEDLEKGSYNGNRQIKVNLLENYIGYDKDMTDEELNELYLDWTIKPQYHSVKLNLNNNTSIVLPFIQDNIEFKVGTNVELYEFLIRSTEVSTFIQDTIFLMVPERIVSTELVIIDVEDALSNLLSIDLLSDDNFSAVKDPNYNWVDHTSSLQLLSQYFSAIQVLAYRMDELLAIPDEADKVYDEIKAIAVDLENTINRIILQVANPETANTGDVLTIEVVGGVKKAVYKPIADVGGFQMVPATKTTLGGVIPKDGFSVDIDGSLIIDPEKFAGPVSVHNNDPDAHSNLKVNLATANVAGAVKITNSLSSTAVDAALSAYAGKLLKDTFSETPEVGKSPLAVDLGDGKVGINKGWLGSSGVGSGVPAGTVVAFSGIFGGTEGKNPIPTGSTEPDVTWELFEPLIDKFIRGGTGQNQGAVPPEGESDTTKPHTLTVAEMPSHSHSFSIGTYGGIAESKGSAQGTQWTNPTGGSQPHSHGQNLPPYYTLAYIIKLPE